MGHATLTAISPLDGRYAARTGAVREIFSEFGLIRLRVLTEVRWVQFLAGEPGVEGLGPLSPGVNELLNNLVTHFSLDDALRIKELEARTNHDVKAVEYFLAERLSADPDGLRVRPFIHFACTSEDINNIAYALMLRQGRDELLMPGFRRLLAALDTMIQALASVPMLARTHGQPATPTTLGKNLPTLRGV